MLMGYSHLTQDERCYICSLGKSGLSNSQAALQLERSHSTTGRELKRNNKC